MTMPKATIIITTVNYPSKAVKRFSAIEDISLTVVGDKKTPHDWSNENTLFLSVEKQEELNYQICKSLPYNHYARKNVGYIHAIRNNAEIIIDTDDDNIPKNGWGFPPFQGSYDCLPPELGFVNVYRHFTDQHVWPRGYPLDLINADNYGFMTAAKADVRVGVWQGLADGDPDVDAVYRLVSNKPCYFDDKDPLVLAAGTICPFNSQNTAITRELFSLLYLPSFVSFRFTDILRGLVAQPIMWQKGFCLGFTKATVVQDRNPHNHLKDFESEIPCYLHAYDVINLVTKSIKPSHDVNDNLYQAYDALCCSGIVDEREIATVSDWLSDISYQPQRGIP